MKRTNEEKITITLAAVALVLFGVSAVTGLMPNLNSSIDKICMYLGLAMTCLSFVFMGKAKKTAKAEQ